MAIGIERRRRDEEQALIAQERLEALIDCIERLAHVNLPRAAYHAARRDPCGAV